MRTVGLKSRPIAAGVEETPPLVEMRSMPRPGFRTGWPALQCNYSVFAGLVSVRQAGLVSLKHGQVVS